MEFVIITGLSGAGKTIAMHALEDIDFYLSLIHIYRTPGHGVREDQRRAHCYFNRRNTKRFDLSLIHI